MSHLSDPTSTDDSRQTLELRLKLPVSEIVFVSALLDGYDGLCSNTSSDEDPEVLILSVSREQAGLLRLLIAQLELAEGRATFEPP